jgi:hypothetical protein
LLTSSFVSCCFTVVLLLIRSVASAVQPQGEKSTTQKIGDAVTGDNRNRDVA